MNDNSPVDSPGDRGEELLREIEDAVNSGDGEREEAAGIAFMQFACEEAFKEPSKDLLLKLEAQDHEFAGDWESAERAYREALRLAEAENNVGMEFKAHYDLCRLYRNTRRFDEAMVEAELASSVARRHEMVQVFTMAFEAHANCLVSLGRLAEAIELLSEALGLLGKERMYDLSRGRALVRRAGCYLKLSQLSSAQSDLDSAWDVLATVHMGSMSAGVVSAHSSWWSVKAGLLSVNGDRAGALEARRKVVEYDRTISHMHHMEGPYRYLSLADGLDKLGLALVVAGDATAADEAFGEAASIRAQLKVPQFSDPVP